MFTIIHETFTMIEFYEATSPTVCTPDMVCFQENTRFSPEDGLVAAIGGRNEYMQLLEVYPGNKITIVGPTGALVYQREWPVEKVPEMTKEERMAFRESEFAQNPNCHWCEQLMELEPDIGFDSELATIEHLIPKSKGGTNDRSNLRLVHKRCNR